MQNFSVDAIGKLIDNQREYYFTGATRSVDFRKRQLVTLKQVIKKYEDEILKALNHDLGKPEFESYVTEVGFVLDSITFFIKHLKRWTRDKKVRTPIFQPFSRSFIRREPYGVTLIIAPFNYPFQLVMEPLLGAIAAGNTVIIKPSEIATATEGIIEKIVMEAFDPRYITVITGGIDETSALINGDFDYMFFTGSERVGKIVLQTAAKKLIPVTLELGGKSPVIIGHDANIKIAAKRIAWGKFINTGQTCIAPDYVYVHKDVEEQFLDSLVKTINEFYGDDPHSHEDYGKIISKSHHERLTGLIDDDKVHLGGDSSEESRHISPTILKGVTWDDKVMGEEIFGPILPVLVYDDLDSIIAEINKRPKPLACYVFSENKNFQEKVMNSISFGGGCINDTISHVATPHMPFGGVGNSGIGGYHGKESYLTFSHGKSILKKSTKIDVPLAFPPYGGRIKLIRWVMGR